MRRLGMRALRTLRPAAVVLAAVALTAAGTTPSTGAPPARPQAVGQQVVTLITGDTVRVAAGQTVQPTPGPGRGGVRFRTERHGDHVSVIPLDALPLIAAQRLDPRLFDVTELLAAGYGDARRSTLPLIVESSTTTLRAAGGTELRSLP